MNKSVFESFDYEKMAKDLEPTIESLKRRIEEIRGTHYSNVAEKADRICALETMLLEVDIERKELLKRAQRRKSGGEHGSYGVRDKVRGKE